MKTEIGRAGRREWIGLAVLTLPTLLLSLDMSVLFLALPHLSEDLGASATQQLWIMDVYGFMIAGLLVTMGTLGDRIGRRRLLLIGATAFSVASVAAAYSTSPEMLIATRAILGVAGATLMPSTLALISTMFTDAQQRGRAIAVWMSAFMGGVALGPVVGGALLEHFWWGGAFLLGVPVMLLLLATGPFLLPEYRAERAGRLDPLSVALSLAAILPVVYGLKEIAKSGWEPLPATAVVAGAAFGVVFARRQRRLPDPLLDLRLFANRTFSSALVIWLLFGLIQGGSYLFFALHLQVVAGLSPMEAGLWLLPSSLAMVVGSQAAPALAQRFRPGSLIAGGLLVTALGYGVLTGVDADGGVAILVTGLVISLLGVGVAAALGTDLILGVVPPAKAGSASALSETSAELGIALGVATLGSLGTAVYRDRLTDALPGGLPDEAVRTATEGITGAAAAAGTLPAGQAGQLIAAAHDAFTTGLTTLAALSAVLFVGLAALAFVTLRHVRPGSEVEAAGPSVAVGEKPGEGGHGDLGRRAGSDVEADGTVHPGDVGGGDPEAGQGRDVRGGMPGVAHHADPADLVGERVTQH
ncbi:MFS transporter [Actinomadura rudentiformis]|uniref:MFS transporter n=1 Tax=Actinomadura rudentiformis TaxID=359158 RepID=A0A6H9YZL6_9ACTN|nr:MFS transporter [Actinomadura rudentiformis]